MHRTATAVGSALNNNNYVMGYVDVDADATTFDSSSATVSSVALPAGSTVLWAGLYWAGDTTAGTSGVAAPTPASRGTVRLQGRRRGLSDRLRPRPPTSSARPRSPTVTAGSATSPRPWPPPAAATYTVANVQAGTGVDRFAGWALFIAYRDTNQVVRGLHVYDGLGTVDGTHTFQTTVAPFHTPVSPAPVTTKVGLLSFEGDAGLANETAKFNNVALTDALNPVNNAMNSTIESGGTRLHREEPELRQPDGDGPGRLPQPGRADQQPDHGIAQLQLLQRVLHALGLLPRLRRGPGDDQRPAERRIPRRAAARRTTARR